MIKGDSNSDNAKKFARFLWRLLWFASEVGAMIPEDCGKYTPNGKYLFFFWLSLQHTEVTWPGIKTAPKQEPELLQWQCWILNPLHHKEAPKHFFFFFNGYTYHRLGAMGSSTRGWIGAVAAGLSHSHSNTRSLTHWARPGIETTPSQTLCQVLNPLSHSGNSQNTFFFFLLSHFWSSCCGTAEAKKKKERKEKKRKSHFFAIVSTSALQLGKASTHLGNKYII